MPQHDVFALGKSGLDDFLFATVGTEVNGSSLAVLSTLARLGDDPWQRAAIWARMSRAAAGAALTAAIAGMPLLAIDLDAAPATAERLIGVLFTGSTAERSSPRATSAGLGVKHVPDISTYLAIGFAVMLLIFVVFMANGAVTPPTAQHPTAAAETRSGP